ncbi:MAG: divalent-cation tolerance protein CutA [Candidatus Thermoplasmatota archaeon]|nr:divalent-cation tolerance protein CutA [Candidatus Thermoplasmatota archaeon]
MYSFVYVTTKNMDEAKNIAEFLLKKKLIACANIFQVKSVYRWKGKIEKENEYAMILKTRKNHVKTIIKEVRAKHSYDVPCIVSFDMKDGNKDFLEWIKSETDTQTK